MRLAERSGTFLPTRAEHHLLRAALLADGDAVRTSFAEWRSRVNLDDVEYGSFRLLPLLYRNLQRHAPGDAAMPRLKGIYRNAWVRNQLVIEHGLRALRLLREATIRAIVLKGGALVADGSYAELALRPMEDVDLLVPPADFRRAFDVLRARGWTLQRRGADPEAYLPFRHAVALRSESGELDLHWAALRDRFDGDDDFWSAAVPATLAGEEVRVLAPPDQLVQLCGHASARNGDVAPIRWVADAWFLLARHGAAFDWERALLVARRRSLSLPLFRCLEYLRDGLGVSIPARVLDELRRDVTLRARLSLHLRNSFGPSIYAYVASVWLRLALRRPFREVPTRLRLLPRYVRAYFRLTDDVSLPRFLARKLIR